MSDDATSTLLTHCRDEIDATLGPHLVGGGPVGAGQLPQPCERRRRRHLAGGGGHAPSYSARPWGTERRGRATTRSRSRRALPDGPILLNGGGNLGDVYARQQGVRERVLEAFVGRPVVQMPQSIWYRDPDLGGRDSATCRGSRSLHAPLTGRGEPGPPHPRSGRRSMVLCPDSLSPDVRVESGCAMRRHRWLPHAGIEAVAPPPGGTGRRGARLARPLSRRTEARGRAVVAALVATTGGAVGPSTGPVLRRSSGGRTRPSPPLRRSGGACRWGGAGSSSRSGCTATSCACTWVSLMCCSTASTERLPRSTGRGRPTVRSRTRPRDLDEALHLARALLGSIR